MGFFRKKLDSDSPTPPATAVERHPSSVASGIRYDPKLIDKLLGEHARLGSLFERIGTLDKAGEYAEVRALLTHFKSSLQAHILTENVRFYVYLEKALAGDPDDAATIHEFRRDMNAIARQVVEFVKTWQGSDFATPAKRRQFTSDYERVGRLLEQRLDSEENSLYPLYQPG